MYNCTCGERSLDKRERKEGVNFRNPRVAITQLRSPPSAGALIIVCGTGLHQQCQVVNTTHSRSETNSIVKRGGEKNRETLNTILCTVDTHRKHIEKPCQTFVVIVEAIHIILWKHAQGGDWPPLLSFAPPIPRQKLQTRHLGPTSTHSLTNNYRTFSCNTGTISLQWTLEELFLSSCSPAHPLLLLHSSL